MSGHKTWSKALLPCITLLWAELVLIQPSLSSQLEPGIWDKVWRQIKSEGPYLKIVERWWLKGTLPFRYTLSLVGILTPLMRGTVSDCPFHVDNRYFITSPTIKKKGENPLFSLLSTLISESSLVRCVETFLCELGANSPASLPQVLIPSFVSLCGCVSSSLENRAPGIYN